MSFSTSGSRGGIEESASIPCGRRKLRRKGGVEDQCDGLSEGYIEVKASSVFGADNSLVPILRYQVPSD